MATRIQIHETQYRQLCIKRILQIALKITHLKVFIIFFWRSLTRLSMYKHICVYDSGNKKVASSWIAKEVLDLMLRGYQAVKVRFLRLEADAVELIHSQWSDALLPVQFPYKRRIYITALRGGMLCYKPEGSGFETSWGESIFSIYLILPSALEPGVHTASNINEYQ
jgi:hypothetical protein